MDGEAPDLTIDSSAVAMMTAGGLRAWRLKRLVLLTPSPLLAAVFPWNRSRNGEEQSQDGWQRSAESDGVATVVANGKEVAGSGASMAHRRGDCRAPWSNARCRMDVASSSSMPQSCCRKLRVERGSY
ncbi:hypothetical protein PIB30_024763 [Stylosanthes scabra]|uniref:Uncharacterized protein n=1 Tax=Stylosanthes scabra TaxID=79078 RepID=A0ABU6UD50_9FABA|nr:hypothetical protein [Stylosanthes scabra]